MTVKPSCKEQTLTTELLEMSVILTTDPKKSNFQRSWLQKSLRTLVK